MAVRLYMDVHVPVAITEQLRRRGVDVLTAADDGATELPDDELLERVRTLERLLFTQDVRFEVLARQWQAQGRPFAGLVSGTIGQFVTDLELIAKASEPEEWANAVERIPYHRRS